MIFKIIGLSCLSVLSINATPILMLRDKLGMLEMKEEYSNFRNRIIELISCPMCLGFWLGFIFLIFFHPFIETLFLASIISILSEFIDKIIKY
jgi:hypothetical protein